MNAAADPGVVTRFAPSPTGYLHIGHAYAALFAARLADKADGRFLVRIEDIDESRCRPEYEAACLEDLAWLGLEWETPVRRQSEHLDDYKAMLARLEELELVYPCFCTRNEIQAEIARAAQAPHLARHGPDGPVYPGTCRALSAGERHDRIAAGAPFALRLDMAKATALAGPLTWTDMERGPQPTRPGIFGDVILARKDVATSYHLAVTVDDAHQGVTVVSRGEDLLAASHIHRLLQALLGLPVPDWHHHPLLTDARGKRFAKRDRSVTLHELRAQGASPRDVLALLDRHAPGILAPG
ncbi:MAG: tRNA glutamyl-Q(34) synthetase GluQRS [Alphaproteobacteria bacterium]